MSRTNVDEGVVLFRPSGMTTKEEAKNDLGLSQGK